MLIYLSMASILGLSAGLAPGPLLSLVISETLHHGIRAGIRVAFAPLISDIPIIAVVLFLFSRFEQVDMLLGIMAIVGGSYIFYLGVSSLRFKGSKLEVTSQSGLSLRKGVIINFLNPAPYLFWFGVGTPILYKAYDENPLFAALFIGIFYLMLVSSKVILAWLTAKSRAFLSGTFYLNTIRLLGLMMCLLAFTLLYDGFKLLNMAPIS